MECTLLRKLFWAEQNSKNEVWKLESIIQVVPVIEAPQYLIANKTLHPAYVSLDSVPELLKNINVDQRETVQR